MHCTVAIFDVDGTLLDSNDAHAQAWVRALADHGHRVEFGSVRRRIGMGGDKLLKETAGIDIGSSVGQRIASVRRSIFSADYLPRLQPTRGARRLVSWLRDRGVVIAIASAAEAKDVDALLAAAEVDDLIDRVASSDEAAASKPDSDIVTVALRKSGHAKDNALMIGDTPYDIEAAASAGIATIAFRTGGWPDAELIGAIAIFDDPADLIDNYRQMLESRGISF